MWLMIAAIVTGIVGYLFINRFLRSLDVGDYGNKYVFITGCDTGFGHRLSIRLNKMGFHVISGCLTQKGADTLTQLCPDRLSALLLNVADSDSIQKAYKHVQDLLPAGKGLWAVVNNAGISGNTSRIEMCTKQDFVDAIDINLFGPIEVSRTFLPLLRQTRGRVVCITSILGRYPSGPAPYCTSKCGLEAFCDVLRREVYLQGIKVSILEPGVFRTNIMDFESLKSKCESSFDQASDEVKTAYGPDYVKNYVTLVSETMKGASTDIDQVVDAYVHAITSKFPRTRYVVGNDAKFIYIPLSLVPDWCGDWIVRSLINYTISKKR
ncbi:retinol dehydrogenase 7-like [Aplysia californica]|uniref:Retinol dehydrogenase 7-like n=1 Tax=Aplysia californica TaxID=6500 RepID=A0ABM0K4F4_APLCA|nr:retinol dehydrogenase 7-like [Aplysia californica]XP_005108510.1 retinol dehydrogenase 7-like [Aplysia californica]